MMTVHVKEPFISSGAITGVLLTNHVFTLNCSRVPSYYCLGCGTRILQLHSNLEDLSTMRPGAIPGADISGAKVEHALRLGRAHRLHWAAAAEDWHPSDLVESRPSL